MHDGSKEPSFLRFKPPGNLLKFCYPSQTNLYVSSSDCYLDLSNNHSRRAWYWWPVYLAWSEQRAFILSRNPQPESLLKFCYPSNSYITHFLSVLPFLVISNINIHHGMTSPLCMMETKSLHFFVKPPENLLKFYFPSNWSESDSDLYHVWTQETPKTNTW